MTTIITEAGRVRPLPKWLDVEIVKGLDEAGRIVVDNFDAFNAPDKEPGALTGHPFLFGLTLCCNAYDKGMEWGVGCRACYGGKRNADEGNYLFRNPDGTFPGLDPVVEVRA